MLWFYKAQGCWQDTMIFRFGDYEFDCQQNTLTKEGQFIALNEKPALMLGVLLSHADKILSKDELLDKVWADRVVTEQVVFQNISYLRAIFGDNAIKTFTKKGYQWQLPYEPVIQNHTEVTDQPDKTKSAGSTSVFLAPKRHRAIICAVLVGIILVCVAYFSNLANDSKPSSHTYLVTSFEGDITHYLHTPEFTAQSAFDSPSSSWQQFAQNENQWIVATRIYPFENQVALRFLIQGKQRGWQDYIVANNVAEANAQFTTLLSVLAQTHYFSAPLTHTAQAELTVLLDNSALSELVYRQLIRLNDELNEFEHANLLAEQQLNKSNNALDRGLLHLIKASVNLRDRKEAAAQESIKAALGIFKALNLAHLEAQALIEQAWLLLAEQEHRQGIQVLNKAANKARMANEPLLEVTAHLNQAFMASKAGLTELSHAQLDMANELLALHKLENSHQVKLRNNAVWVAESGEEQFAHQQAILAMPFTPEYESYFYDAAKAVRDRYLQRGEWNLALSTLKGWQRESFQLLTKAHIGFAKQDWPQGLAQAEQAFIQAQMAHYKVDALDAALLLLTHHASNQIQIDKTKYLDFIQQKATRRWRSQNSKALVALNMGSL